MTVEVKILHYKNGNPQYESRFLNAKRHGVQKGYYETGKICYTTPHINGKRHGVQRKYNESGELIGRWPCLYGDEVTEEEYRRHELTEELAKL